jgi:hypothetical protein
MTIVPVDPPRIPFNVTMSDLQQSKWIDIKTRALFFDFTFFQPQHQSVLGDAHLH